MKKASKGLEIFANVKLAHYIREQGLACVSAGLLSAPKSALASYEVCEEYVNEDTLEVYRFFCLYYISRFGKLRKVLENGRRMTLESNFFS